MSNTKIELIENMPIDEVIPYDKNYLNHDNNREYVKNSIGTFDFTTPIEISEDNIILAGHARYEALKMMGETHIPRVLKISGWDKKKQTAYRFANNASANKAEIIYDNVEYDLSIIEDAYALEDFGFDYDNKKKIDGEQEKDLSDTIEAQYEVVCECPNEKEQEALFLRLSNEGIKCRLLTM